VVKPLKTGVQQEIRRFTCRISKAGALPQILFPSNKS
jgi:hypothetical protein